MNTVINTNFWDLSINNTNFLLSNKHKIMRVFPKLSNVENYSNILIDEESFKYITIREISDLISKIISYHLISSNINPLKISIVDYTAGVGGNVLSFCNFYKHVFAIEIDKTRHEYLKLNAEIYKFKNVTCINGSCIDYINKKYNIRNLDLDLDLDHDLNDIVPNVIFIDPPWGGSSYKNTPLLRLSISGISIENIIKNIFEGHITNKLIFPKTYNNVFIVLKLPKNYDINYFYDCVKKLNSEYYYLQTFIYILNKMLIIVCHIVIK